MDGDGHPDIVVSSWVGPVSVLMADGEGGFAGAAAYPLDTTANVRDVVVADLTGDGAPEVVVAGGRVQVLTNDGEGGLPSRWQTGTTDARSEEHTSELQSLMRHSYAVICLKKNKREH